VQLVAQVDLQAPLAALAERGLSAPELEVRERLLESKAQAQQAALA
jgi:hypothetical protein